MIVIPNDFGVHQRLKSSGLAHASNTTRAGPLKVRVTTNSRSDARSAVVELFAAPGSFCAAVSIALFLLNQFFDDIVERIEALGPKFAVIFDPGLLFGQLQRAQRAGPHPTDLFGGGKA